MSTETYKPGDLAMVREPLTDDEPVLALFDGNAWYGDSTGAVWGQGAVTVVRRLKAVPADAIVLDRDGLREVVRILDENGAFGSLALVAHVANIRAQITPPEPQMEEPTERGFSVEDDRGIWTRVGHVTDPGPWGEVGDLRWSSWSQMENPRPFES